MNCKNSSGKSWIFVAVGLVFAPRISRPAWAQLIPTDIVAKFTLIGDTARFDTLWARDTSLIELAFWVTNNNGEDTLLMHDRYGFGVYIVPVSRRKSIPTGTTDSIHFLIQKNSCPAFPPPPAPFVRFGIDVVPLPGGG